MSVETDLGMIKDVQKTVLELCRDAFSESEYLRYSPARPADPNFVDMDILNARVNDLPSLYAWVEGMKEDPNQVGALGGGAKREKLSFLVQVVYVNEHSETLEGSDTVRQIGWLLKEKLTAHSDLEGLSNMSGKLLALNFEPELILKDDRLVAADTAKLILEYEAVRTRRRVSKYGG